MSTARRLTLAGAASTLEELESRLGRVPISRQMYNAWAVRARAAGYPPCETCQEPLPKRLHGKETRCDFCRALDQKYP